MAKILKGGIVRDCIEHDLIEKIGQLKSVPALAIIQVGNRGESNVYVKQKILFGEKIGVKVVHLLYPEGVTESMLIGQIEKLNEDKLINGILVQLPLPKHINSGRVIEAIAPEKDVDGMTAANVKFLMGGGAFGMIPATVRGILTLLDHYKILISGKKVVVVGRSMLVGKPLLLAFLNRHATVTICHTHTENLPKETQDADILVVAAGEAEFVNENHVSPGQVVVDVGITRLSNDVGEARLYGDVKFEAVEKIVDAITPVPGGIGPMTVVSLFQNLMDAYNFQHSKK